MRPRILCAMPIGTYRRLMTPEMEERLNSLGEVVRCDDPRGLSDSEYGALWEQADAVLTGWGVRPPTPEMIDRATHLRVVAHSAGSLRMFPRYLVEKGIPLTTARAAIARTVAEFCLLNALCLLRRYHVMLRGGPAAGEAAPLPNATLYDKTVGLVGFGCIGRIFRRLLQPFGCRVLVYDPYLSATEAESAQVESVALHLLLAESHVISLHAPDIPQTYRMIGAAELALIRDGAVFLNSARGRLVDTEALTKELSTGRFFAAIDVSDPEPLPNDHPLRTLPNVIFTPHVAGPTTDELPRLMAMAIDDMARVLNGQPPLYPITLQTYDLMSF